MAREQVKLKKGPAPVEIGKGVLVRAGARIADDPWVLLADGQPAPDGADVVVPLARFLSERGTLVARAGGRLGVAMDAADPAEAIADATAQLALIMVRFPVFKDGRGFTSARLIRERFGFSGELRAVGEVLEDQVYFMMRCGFDAFEIIAKDPEAAYARAAATFSAAYQPAADRRPAVGVLRRDPAN